MSSTVENEIQELVDLETEGWNTKNPELLLSIFHHDMVWAWPPSADEHDPADWQFVMGRFNRDRWRNIWTGFFAEYELIHNIRHTEKIIVTDEGDGALAVVDIDTLWRHKETRAESRWKGRVSKAYTRLSDGEWKLISHTGVLDYKKNSHMKSVHRFARSGFIPKKIGRTASSVNRPVLNLKHLADTSIPRVVVGLIGLLILFVPSCIFGNKKADMVLVIKSESRLYLMKNEKVLSEHRVAFGANPKGHKHQEGDERTPEGTYVLDYKKDNSAFYKAIHISYPNENDKKWAQEAGINPGGLIMIHGQKNGLGWLSWIVQYFNWTDGCIAVSNRSMDIIWESVDVGIPIKIIP